MSKANTPQLMRTELHAEAGHAHRQRSASSLFSIKPAGIFNEATAPSQLKVPAMSKIFPQGGTAPDSWHDQLRGFPSATAEAVLAFRDRPALDTLDRALRALLEFYLPRPSRRSLAEEPGSARLKEDLGLDSLALAEAVFKWDDLFGVPIETREAAGLTTLAQLRDFLAVKMGVDAPALPPS